MNLRSQEVCLSRLQDFAKSDRHSILIDGVKGSGKSFLAKQYASMLDILDFAVVVPTVSEIRESLSYSYKSSDPIVFCIENLDTGVPAASYTLLKFLEEPVSNVYIVVTCRNRYDVPDTIVSRCTSMTLTAPTKSDVDEYAAVIHPREFQKLKTTDLWRAVRTFSDVEYLCTLPDTNLEYLYSYKSLLNMKDSISNLAWKLCHYEDNTEIDLPLVINLIMLHASSSRIQKYCRQCSTELSNARVAKHAIIAKLLFECKYGD